MLPDLLQIEFDRVRSRPEHQIQFEEGYDNYPGQEKTADLTKRYQALQSAGFCLCSLFLP